MKKRYLYSLVFPPAFLAAAYAVWKIIVWLQSFESGVFVFFGFEFGLLMLAGYFFGKTCEKTK